jgi:hypothetical protein
VDGVLVDYRAAAIGDNLSPTAVGGSTSASAMTEQAAATTASVMANTTKATASARGYATSINAVTSNYAVTSIAAVTGRGFFLTAQQSEPDDREEQRDAKQKYSIHSEPSKK